MYATVYETVAWNANVKISRNVSSCVKQFCYFYDRIVDTFYWSKLFIGYRDVNVSEENFKTSWNIDFMYRDKKWYIECKSTFTLLQAII